MHLKYLRFAFCQVFQEQALPPLIQHWRSCCLAIATTCSERSSAKMIHLSGLKLPGENLEMRIGETSLGMIWIWPCLEFLIYVLLELRDCRPVWTSRCLCTGGTWPGSTPGPRCCWRWGTPSSGTTPSTTPSDRLYPWSPSPGSAYLWSVWSLSQGLGMSHS